ncbi:MAG: hypothetical protein RBR74_06810 [Ignavibacteriaceae bacterium]|jgi:CRISPR-associated protein Csm4|nr:hypothetical protein [Ignavibacteriaceae bacterium]
MKTYILPLKQKSGLLTDLQSDTIYGHFCWRLKERLGEEKLTDFISLYRNNKPVFTLSDGLLQINDEIHFPRPFIFSKPEIKQTKSEKVLEFVNRKSDKEKNYFTISELKKFLSSGEIIIDRNNLQTNSKKSRSTRPAKTESLRVSVQIDRSTFGNSEGKLFSYKPEYTREDVSYVIFIKVLNEKAYYDFSCEDIIKEIFTIGYGKKKSSGYGQFEVGEVREYNEFTEPENSNAFLVLGNYLPSVSDKVLPIGYDINTKYGKLGEELSQSVNPFKNPMVFLIAGSCFKSNVNAAYHGRITDDSEISESNTFAVQFGMPFTLKFNLGSTDY